MLQFLRARRGVGSKPGMNRFPFVLGALIGCLTAMIPEVKLET